MDTYLRDELDRSFGDGPPMDDVSTLLDHGHRALRRRWLATGGTAVAVAAIAVSVSVVLGSGPGESTGVPVAPPSAPATPSPGTPSETPQDTNVDGVVLVPDPSLRRLTPVDIAQDGSVHFRPDVQVTVAVPNPFEELDLSASAAVIYLVHGEPHWYVGYLDARGGGSAAQTPAQDGVSFHDWVAEQESILGPGRGVTSGDNPSGDWPGRVDLQLVRFAGPTERLDPVDAVTLLEQRPHPDVGDSFATADDQSAVAEVRFEGERYYVLARRSAGQAPQYIAVAAEDGGATLDDFLADARIRYAEGGGGLL